MRLVRAVQPEKAKLPIFFTELGIMILVSSLQSEIVLHAISISCFGRTRLVRPVQLINAPELMVFTESGVE